MPDAAILEGVRLGFGSGAGRVEALRGIYAAFRPGELTLVTGPSGSGKTSLLSVLGAMVRPDAGNVRLGDEALDGMNTEELTAFRRRRVGFVFQAFRLMRTLSAVENVALSLDLRGVGPGARAASLQALEAVGLGAKAHLRPDEMSGGEKQRVAVARALAHNPPLLLADEPTASLDAENGRRVMELIHAVACTPDRVVVVVSHDERVRPFADRVIRMEDGVIALDERA